jgi:hypothetical protein
MFAAVAPVETDSYRSRPYPHGLCTLSRDRASNVIGSTNEAGPNLDFIAEDAGDGALEAEIGRNTVTVVVERNGNDAEDTLNAYESFGDGVHERHGNVVLVWSKTPTDDEREAVESCLDG